MNHYIVGIYWPPQGRERHGHNYKYLVLADTEEQAIARAEGRWAGKQGGANPHETLVLGKVEGTYLFELATLPEECR